MINEKLNSLIDQYIEENLIGKFSDTDTEFIKEILRDFVTNYTSIQRVEDFTQFINKLLDDIHNIDPELSHERTKEFNKLQFKEPLVNNEPFSECEYELLIADKGMPFEVNAWIPIKTDYIIDPSRIGEYLEKGILRKRK